MKTQVYAFAKINNQNARHEVFKEIEQGKSRFGMWDQSKSLKEKGYGKNAFLLRVREGDWIVHVNMPEYGRCVAVKAAGEYQFDEGIKCKWGNDFNNFIPVDTETILVFDRKDPTIIPTVNLTPRRRAQRILEVNDFLESIENLKQRKKYIIMKSEKTLSQLREKVSKLLPEITEHIREMNSSKEFERFLHRIFSDMPNTVTVQNGFGWRTDHGADLIVEFDNPIIRVNVRTKTYSSGKIIFRRPL